MNRCRSAIGAAIMVASGLTFAMAGTATATAEAPSVVAEASTGSANTLIGILGLLATGSSGSGSSVSFGTGNVAGTTPSTGSSGTGSAALCTTNPSTAGCPK